MPPGRRRANGPGRREKQHKRAAATYADKLAVVRHYEWSRDMPLTVKEFHPALDGDAARSKARLFYRWVQQKEIIAARADSAKTSRQARVRRTGVATTLGADGERELVGWLCEARRRGERVSTDALRARALEIARARNVPEGVFAGSSTWQKGFLERHRDALQQDDSGGADAGEGEGEEEVGGDADAGDEDVDMTEEDEQAAAAAAAATDTVDETPVETVADDDYDYEDAGLSATSESGNELDPHSSPEPAESAAAPPQVSTEPTPVAATSARERGRQAPAPRRERAIAPTPSSNSAATQQLSDAHAAVNVNTRTTSAQRAVLLSPVVQHAASPVSTPAVPSPEAVPAAIAVEAAAPAEVTASPAHAVATTGVDEEERGARRRRAEIEERKAELLNESLRYDNVLKRIKVAEENALARKRLKDAGVAQEEIDALLPMLR